MEKSVMIVTVPPELIRGSGIPVAGIAPRLVPTLINTPKSSCNPIPIHMRESIFSSTKFIPVVKQTSTITAYKPRRKRIRD